jgi:GNAT superfamily N-acetyltransferase
MAPYCLFFGKMSGYCFTETGDHKFDIFNGVLITHGTSLWLMTKVFECIQDSDLHNINPNKDWKKGVRCDLNNYYIVASTEHFECASCVRLLYNAHTLIIEYLYTIPDARSCGVGKKLIDFCRVLSKQRDVLVIATEDACAYWMKLGFIWDASKDTEALNKFNDTYLLSDTV